MLSALAEDGSLFFTEDLMRVPGVIGCDSIKVRPLVEPAPFTTCFTAIGNLPRHWKKFHTYAALIFEEKALLGVVKNAGGHLLPCLYPDPKERRVPHINIEPDEHCEIWLPAMVCAQIKDPRYEWERETRFIVASDTNLVHGPGEGDDPKPFVEVPLGSVRPVCVAVDADLGQSELDEVAELLRSHDWSDVPVCRGGVSRGNRWF